MIKASTSAYKVLVLVTLLCLITVFVFSALSATYRPSISENLYNNVTTSQVSRFYFIEITPTSKTFSIWSFIYAWQLLWMLYAVITAFLPSWKHQLPCILLMAFMLSCFFNIAWGLVWSRYQPLATFIILALFAAVVYLAIISGMLYSEKINIREQKILKVCTELLVVNGLCFYATWLSIATLINLAVFLAYGVGVPQSLASTVALGVLSFELLVYFVLENIVLEKYFRYIFSVYPVVITALAGSLARNWNPGAVNSIFTLVLLVVTVLATVARLYLSVRKLVLRRCRQSINIQDIEAKVILP